MDGGPGWSFGCVSRKCASDFAQDDEFLGGAGGREKAGLFASVEMTILGWVREVVNAAISPLRFASVEMTGVRSAKEIEMIVGH